MSKPAENKPRASSGPAKPAAQQRRDRLAEELRANLKKRKALARKRQQPDTGAGVDPPSGQPDGS